MTANQLLSPKISTLNKWRKRLVLEHREGMCSGAAGESQPLRLCRPSRHKSSLTMSPQRRGKATTSTQHFSNIVRTYLENIAIARRTRVFGEIFWQNVSNAETKTHPISLSISLTLSHTHADSERSVFFSTLFRFPCCPVRCGLSGCQRVGRGWGRTGVGHETDRACRIPNKSHPSHGNGQEWQRRTLEQKKGSVRWTPSKMVQC